MVAGFGRARTKSAAMAPLGTTAKSEKRITSRTSYTKGHCQPLVIVRVTLLLCIHAITGTASTQITFPSAQSDKTPLTRSGAAEGSSGHPDGLLDRNAGSSIAELREICAPPV